MRLDKFLADMGCGTRSRLKNDIRKGAVAVNGETVKKADLQVSPETDEVCYQGRKLTYVKMEYYMLNKPAGCVSATEDPVHKTALSYIDSVRKDLFPVGRLDIDTEGLLLVTNDGALAHELLSPKKHMPKTYYAEVDGAITSQDIALFAEGMDIGEKRPTLPAELTVLSAGAVFRAEVTVYEGKFHQVKRMFEKTGKHVRYLKRISFCGLKLDGQLAPGEYRSLTKDELALLRAEHKERL